MQAFPFLHIAKYKKFRNGNRNGWVTNSLVLNTSQPFNGLSDEAKSGLITLVFIKDLTFIFEDSINVFVRLFMEEEYQYYTNTGTV